MMSSCQCSIGAPPARLVAIDDVELVEELSVLTTQTARLRSRMVDIMTELDRRRAR
jgi:hypothetical protein